MAISKKGKRKLVHNDKVYYWAVIDDRDSLDHILTIMTEDKKLLLHYPLEQINVYFPHPKYRVLESPELPNGIYSFFPPEVDESATPSLVILVLACYEKDVDRYLKQQN